MSEGISTSTQVIANAIVTVWAVGLLTVVTFPLMRGLAVTLSTARWLRRVGPGWLRPKLSPDDPERPLLVHAMSPGLASLARQTRTLALELRRRSVEARYWPTDAAAVETVAAQAGWRSFFGAELDVFTPLLDTRRDVWDWLQTVERLDVRDHETLAELGVDPRGVREALEDGLGAGRELAEGVTALAGLLWAIDERLASANAGPGYRASGAELRVGSRLPGSGVLAPSLGDGDTDGDQDRDEDARARRLATVLAEHSPGIAKIAASYGRTPAEREDLQQDIALALCRALPTYRGDSSLKTFVHRVAQYSCFRALRRRRTVVSWGSSDPSSLVDLVDLIDEQTCPEAALLDDDARARVRAAVSALPEALGSTIDLHLRGLSYAEIAESLGISERNVSVRLTRARKRLRHQLCAA